MKILVASDIHGSYEACKMVFDKFHEIKADRILFLGDLLYHGPRNNFPSQYEPQSVIDLLNSEKRNIIAVKGNCDTEVDQMVLDFPIMAEYNYITLKDKVIFATHGHKFGVENLPPLNDNDILLTGHTHVACDVFIDSIRYMNPGSPAIPKGNTRPSYIVIDENDAQLFEF